MTFCGTEKFGSGKVTHLPLGSKNQTPGVFLCVCVCVCVFCLVFLCYPESLLQHPGPEECEILVPRPGIEPMFPELEG